MTTERSGPLTGKHVLVVDDDADTREIADTMLTHRGATVTVSTTPEHAITMLTLASDVVITDLGFAGERMAGLRVLEAARQASPGSKVIAVTGRKDAPETVLKAFDVVIVKPVDPFLLGATVIGAVAPSKP